MKAAVVGESGHPLVDGDRPVPSPAWYGKQVEGPMGDRHDQPSAARQDLDLLVGDLSTVCGQLEEFATMWRRQCHARDSWRDMPHAFPQELQGAAGRLAGTLRALVAAGPDQNPDLAFSAAAQMTALDGGLAAAVAGTGHSLTGAAVTGDACSSTPLRAAAVCATISRAQTRQRSLLAHLAPDQETTAKRAA